MEGITSSTLLAPQPEAPIATTKKTNDAPWATIHALWNHCDVKIVNIWCVIHIKFIPLYINGAVPQGMYVTMRVIEEDDETFDLERSMLFLVPLIFLFFSALAYRMGRQMRIAPRVETTHQHTN